MEGLIEDAVELHCGKCRIKLFMEQDAASIFTIPFSVLFDNFVEVHSLECLFNLLFFVVNVQQSATGKKSTLPE